MLSWLKIGWGLLGGVSLNAWLIVGAVAGFGIWTWIVFDAGYDKADALWTAKALEAKIAKLEREALIREEADRREAQYIRELNAENEQYEKVIDDYTKELAKRPDKCLLGPDAGRLQ